MNRTTLAVASAILMFVVSSGIAFGQDRELLIENLPTVDSEELRQLREQLDISVRELGPSSQVWTITENQVQDAIERLRAAENVPGLDVEQLGGDYRSLFYLGTQTADLSPSQQDVLRSISESSTTKSVTISQLAPLPIATFALTEGFDERDGFDAPGSLTIQISPEEQLTIIKEEVQFTPNGYVWKGRPADSQGTVLLMSQGGSVTGTINTGNRLVSIRPLGANAHAIVEKDVQQFPEEHPPSFQETQDNVPDAQDTPPGDAPEVDELIEIDLVVAYTHKAAANYVDIVRDLISLAVQESNTINEESHIPNVTFKLVYAYETDYEESDVWDDHLRYFAGANDQKMDEIHTTRTKYKGDVALLIIDDSDYCGVASDIYAEDSTAFAVVHHDCAAGYYSFAHEIGHLLGARHDLNVDPDNGHRFAYGHGFFHDNAWRTVMSYGNGCGGCTRREYWSSPNVEINGVKAGTAEHEDNARVVREESRRISRFR